MLLYVLCMNPTKPLDEQTPTTLESQLGRSIAKESFDKIRADRDQQSKDKHAAQSKIDALNERLDRIAKLNKAVPCHCDNALEVSQSDKRLLDRVKAETLQMIESYTYPRANLIGMNQTKCILLSLENGASIMHACNAAHVSPVRFYAQLKVDRALADAYEMIQDAKAMMVEDALYNAATNPETYGHVTAAIYWSKNRAAHR